MDDKFFIQNFFVLFQEVSPNGIFLSNHHLLALDGHGLHVGLNAIKHAQQFGLNMITLPSHTSHATFRCELF